MYFPSNRIRKKHINDLIQYYYKQTVGSFKIGQSPTVEHKTEREHLPVIVGPCE